MLSLSEIATAEIMAGTPVYQPRRRTGAEPTSLGALRAVDGRDLT
jgi:hypothetical protein